jgi:ribosomal-protein-alanine N-acetyltransferase
MGMNTGPRSRLLLRAMTPGDAERLAEWRYCGQLSVYNLGSPAVILDEMNNYWSITDSAGESLVGFVCAGQPARVPGLDEDPSVVDVGVGMNPSLVGQGRGSAFGQAVLNHLDGLYPGRPLRAAIQAWNVRSLRFSQSLGFVDHGEFISKQGDRQVHYRILVKPLLQQ